MKSCSQQSCIALGALLLILAPGGFVSGADNQTIAQGVSTDNAIAKPPAASGQSVQSQSAGQDWVYKLRRTPAQVDQGTPLFEKKSWSPPPPVAKAEPTVPPFPFHYMGKLEREGMPTIIYFTKGNQVYSASTGQVIDGTYRIDQVEADRIEVTYLPLKKKQTIAFADILPPAQGSGVFGGNPSPVSEIRANPSSPPLGPQASSAPVSGTSGGIVGGMSAVLPAITSGGTGGSAVASGQAASMMGSPGQNSAPGSSNAGTTVSAGGQGGAAQSGGDNSGVMIISPPTIERMPVFAPTVSSMPVFPPTISAMPISPPTMKQMPISPAIGNP